MAVDFGAEGAGCVFSFVGGDFDGDYGVGFYLDQRGLGLIAGLGEVAAPLFLVAEITAIGDDEGGVLGVMGGDFFWGAFFDEEEDVSHF